MADNLSALDASFLAAERPEVPLHIGGVARFEGGPLLDDDGRLRLDDIRAVVEAHLAAIPRFRQRLRPAAGGLGLPRWCDDDGFDITEHVRTRRVPAPGLEDDLHRLAMALQAQPLPRDRPLWELTFVDGLADGSVALVDKAHHALVDGVSGSESFITMLDRDPAAPPAVPAPWAPSPAPATAHRLLDELRRAARLPVDAARGTVDLVRDPAALAALLGTAAETLRTRRPAPRCSLNAAVGARRDHRVVRWSLADAKHIAHATGTTVNDVALTAVTGGLRALLAGRGELAGLDHLTALVPVSTRGADEMLGLGNRVSGVLATLPLTHVDPLECLRQVRADMDAHKEGHEVELFAALLGTADWLPLPLVTVLSELTVNRQPVVNLVVTNVRGSPTPLYLRGARMLEFQPYVPLGANTTVGVAILSYDGQLDVGVTVDPDACPDAAVLVDGIEAAFAALLDSTG
ncbi:wax ester/triacylglycerol synthase family O-acyltransferase [Rhabdothermincola salaria]|uniref:wax ester/triacylglycerol synthase family O-acyltransferase n=1 Tax=Rhabdothermincola salaria TaxID=2903142 RepID=UPI001E464475|nr:wax ester/triacylglycerol synthase family O-acyltransferase [Rhabdothermincola salaria]